MTKTFSISEYLLLAGRLTKEELECLSHCKVFDDCAIDGICEIQRKVDNIVKEL